MSPRRGPDLPYSIVAGVTPWRTRWLVASAKMAGATFAPEQPRLFDSFGEILSESPAFSLVVVNAPIGYRDDRIDGNRTCEKEARKLLGRRGVTVRSAPTRSLVLEGANIGGKNGLDAVTAKLLPRYREVATEMSPYRQRVVYEGHPELSFYHMNGSKAMQWPKSSEAGTQERIQVLISKIPDIARIIESEAADLPQKHLLDCAALLWTARRVLGHAAVRIPAAAEWDSEGLRIEIVL